VPDVTRDFINYNNTFQILELYSLQRYFPVTEVEIDGELIIREKPSLNIGKNYTKAPAYSDWHKSMERS